MLAKFFLESYNKREVEWARRLFSRNQALTRSNYGLCSKPKLSKNFIENTAVLTTVF